MPSGIALELSVAAAALSVLAACQDPHAAVSSWPTNFGLLRVYFRQPTTQRAADLLHDLLTLIEQTLRVFRGHLHPL